MKDRNGAGLSGEVEAWVDRMEDAEVDGVEIGEVVDEDGVVGSGGGGGGGARSTSHWSDAMGMLKGLGCHWHNMP